MTRPKEKLPQDVGELMARVAELEETIRAIQSGEVDALVISTPNGERVYTLETADQPYRFFVETMTEGAVTAADNGIILYCNAAFAEILRLLPETIVGSYIISYIAPDHLQDWERFWQEAITGPTEREFVLLVSGREIPVNLTMKPFPVAQGSGVSIVVTDLTLRKQAEAALERYSRHLEEMISERTAKLKKSEERLERTSGLARIGGWELDAVTRAVNWTEEMYHIHEIPVGTAVTLKEAISFFHPLERKRLFDAIEHALTSGDGYDMELRFITAGGRHLWIRTVFKSETSDGKLRLTGMLQDITDRKLNEIQREALICELEKKNMELEQFSYTVSHDLKSPLITIKGFAGMLESEADQGDVVQMKKDIEQIKQAANKMQQFLIELFELSRIGRIVAPPKRTPFGLIAKEAVDLLAAPLAERGVVVEIAPNLPEVSVDHTRIREVLVNLIENAVKYMGDQQNPTIRIGVNLRGRGPVFFVQDNGVGINPKYLGRIFNLFEKMDPSSPGSGLGLSIAKRIIDVHGGRIWAESEGPEKGTTFRFTLPLA